MYLASIKISNFRLFESFYLELNKGLNLLVGENDSGKTALIDAICLVLDTNSTEWIRIQEDDFQSGKESLSIQLKFDELSLIDAAVFVEHLTFENIGETTQKLALYVTLNASMGGYIGRKGTFIKTDIRSGLNIEGPQIERESRMYLSTTYLKPLRDAQNELSAGRVSRLSQLLTSPKSIGGDNNAMERLIDLIIRANQAIKSDAAITASRNAIDVLLKAITFKSDKFTPIIDMLASKELTAMNEPEKKMVFKAIVERLSLGLDETGKPHGLGYSNLLFMAAELMLLKKEGEGFPLLLIEEPEAHLHPQLQMKFIKYLLEQHSLQCILSTHSPNLASKVPLENLILMQQGTPYPLRKGCTALQNDDYPFLEKFLDVTKANMFFAKGVILVEGDGENILLPTIAELLGRPLEDYGVSIVNIGNLAYKRYAKIYRPNNKNDGGLPIKVACVTDLDIWPDKAEKLASNPIGFKEKIQPDSNNQKKGNLNRWVCYYTDKPQKLEKRKDNKTKHDGDNVKTFISEEWTFEYCLAKYGLAEEIYTAINGSNEGFSELSKNDEERAIQIYRKISEKESGKTDMAYKLAELLQSYKNRSMELKSKLPPYIIKAIEYVTEPLIEPEEQEKFTSERDM